MTLNRRQFVQAAATLGAALAWGGRAAASKTKWRERRDLFPEGVASGDPEPDSVILWTRRPFDSGGRRMLTVEVAEDPAFRRVVAAAPAPVSDASDWTSRVLVGGLRPARVYWYRFTDAHGNGSRIGRTITAPRRDDPRPVSFTFVSCQSLNEGKLNGYRRMIYEDERAPAAEQIGFVLHLGDFIYEVVQYPEEVKTRYDRTIYEVARIENGMKVRDFHVPLTVGGYRAVWQGYLADPDLQDARARWPFVCIWDNHEFSWQGRQSIVQAGGDPQPGQTVKVAANQAWFEFIPARVSPPSGSLAEFGPPPVNNVKIERWDDNDLGQEPNNLTAIRSLIAYRALRYGRHLDLMITDQHSFCGADPTDAEGVGKIYDPSFNGMFSEPAMIALDAGRAANRGKPPAELSFRDATIPNPRKGLAPRTILGAEQKAWFTQRLKTSTATWKIWANSYGALDQRVDPEHIPAEMVATPWPVNTFAMLGSNDYGSAYHERGEIYDLVRDERITGFGIVSGDRHSFWAGYAAAQLPPGKFEPVGVSFVGASLISPGAMESFEHRLKPDAKLRPLYLADRPGAARPDWSYNMLLRHGVRSAIEYAKSFDLEKARALSNPALAPHLEFVDMGAHGFAKVRLDGEAMRTEFVCIPRPVTRSEAPDGGPLRYRVAHTARLWRAGERPRLQQEVIEGDPGLSI
ncbi:alkaline phosphatase D family protein [Sphingomonas sp.]|uniref:alkaline phosphatase D family protein n=1 Tax=Sphingomonas sp. TaxID=28214 RepID=UPI00286E58BC|nr:alkaline phosphatase D family protein [Sphingomonas sp.]